MIVTLPEALIISRATELRSLLLSALERGEPVELDGRKVNEVDLAGLQVLCAAHRTAMARGRALNLSRDRRSAALQDAIELSGLSHVSSEAWLREGKRDG
jgi:anti-anti-sigma regulatory factor